MSSIIHPFMEIVGLLLLISGLQLIRGKWLFLIAGYNTMTKEEKKQYDGHQLGKLVGSFLVYLSLVCLVSNLLSAKLLIAMIILPTIPVVVIANTSKKIRR
ncbi:MULTISPECIES: DUF3784 domain-containing protein [Enterococcus]|uniref:DUF3784 domain-containing protein n=1 Tax=Candidatus Enterococcus murrayae TaxID=2815321 RepID=A0ABS3HNF6_9ENTE|nr:DUF3784 domain-containing protein [Enterococcus sp. MJM16]MBO0454469.1 DUF3784 domain-containing protein [Enterococcus sp. MJM16]